MATYVFPGQGSQQKGMGKDLFTRYPGIVAIADGVLGYSIRELCLDDPKGSLSETRFTQPALYVVNALTWYYTLETNKTRPNYVAGHSLGEYNALLAAEVFDFETGLRLVKKRGELMGKVKGGGMAAIVGLSDKDIERILAANSFTGIDIANRNTPSQIVISGLVEEIQKAQPVLEASGAKMVIPLRVSAPFHSRYMASAKSEFRDFLSPLQLSQPKIPVISNVEARPYPDTRIRELLAEQITSSVHWTETIQYLIAMGETEFVELGPGTVLTGLVKKIQEAEPLQLEKEGPAYRKHGVYVVIGGAGGIGTVWSEYVIRNYGAQVVWIGRRQLNETIVANIDRLVQYGPRPIYISADATDRASLQSAYDEIKRHFSRINGLVHAAIVLQDQSLAKMEEEVFRASLSAKVDVSVRMAQVFASEALDFVLFFSSITAFAKSAGQSNYAAGCTFKDAFAHRLSAVWPCEVKVMNWAYWGRTGAVSSAAYRDRMEQLGMGSIESQEGMDALGTLLDGPISQLAMLKLTKPIAMSGVNLAESLDDSTHRLPSLIEVILNKEQQRHPAGRGLTAALLRQRREVEALLHKLLWVQLRQLIRPGETTLEINEWIERRGIAAAYAAWLEESCSALCRAGIVTSRGAAFELPSNDFTSESAWREWEQLKSGSVEEDIRAQLALVEATLHALPDILVGKRRATDVIFPNSSMQLVGAIYRNNRVADYFNDVLADAAAAYCQARIEGDTATRLRILEIGAGTGGSTATVLKRLEPFAQHIADYCYTDISNAFLIHGERAFGAGNPFLSFRTFNVELDPATQDLPLDSFDLVIAANVLHATGRIRQTVRHAKALLHKNGLLLLNELSEKTLFSHLTFGLLQGWWLYEDPVLRIKGTPALSPETWKRVLEDGGFRSVGFAAAAHEFGQQIIVAESDGRIRRQVSGTRKETSVKQFSDSDKPSPGGLREKARGYFKKVIGETLKIPSHKIATSELLQKYGIDSINIVQITNALRNDLGDIDSTLFFEYQTIDAVVEHFITTRRETLVAVLGDESVSQSKEVSAKTPLPPKVMSRLSSGSSKGSTPLPINSREPIAIIGVAGRYPQAETLAEFWDVLQNAKNCITEIPRDRWPWEKYFDSEPGKWGAIYTKWGGFLKDIDKFDPLFFQISPVDAKRMDPQERLFLEIAYASIEDAGYTPALLSESRKIGVFVGVMNSTYRAQSSHWSIANRVSYSFDFQGPSLAVDTACSSSLTAIHLAVESIRGGTSECAIAGGVNLIVDPVHYWGLSLPRMLSASDKCRPFGDDADGFVDAEGVGAIVLKPLTRAIADGDHIYGVIKGTAINSGGRTNGFTVPNPNAQSQVIADALRTADVHPRTISYIEAQATGTILGDPIEIAGLKRAFEQQTNEKGFCAIGSVKSNIGHCESASGIAGVTKVLLQMQRRTLVPSIHSETLNSNIRFASTPFVVQHALAGWERPVVTLNDESREYPRIAGISSFGAGGANAHVIIEEFLDERSHSTSDAPVLILLSARNEDGLDRVIGRLSDFMQQARRNDSLPGLRDLAFTLQVGRVPMEERLAMMVDSMAQLEEKLAQLNENQRDVDGVYRARAKKNTEVASLFSDDEELAEAIDKWLEKRKLSKLMELWLLGVNVDWSRLYKDTKPLRISLPAYPFAKERHWLEDFERKEIAAMDIASQVEIDENVEHDTAEPVPSPTSLEDHVRKTIVTNLSETLAIDQKAFDFDDSFADFGLDSITGNQLVERISRALKINLNVSRLFDYTTVNRLTTYIATEHRNEIAPAASPSRVLRNGRRSAKRVASAKPGQKEPIAIIGMSGRFPKSKSLDELWKNLSAGNDLIGEVSRWDLAAHYAAESLPDDGKSFHGGSLDDIDQFDPMFFNISALEATYMDPQQRLFLEESWRAMEDAGYAGQCVDGLSCGVYVGCGSGDYFRLFQGATPAQSFWGNAASVLPARIAYYMNLQGPAIPVDTACSSSLVAIHLACQGLWAGETQMALAGGVYVQSTPVFFILSSRAGMLSPTGRCHTFDKAADGFAMGEGVAALVLKRLSDAIADGDHIYGVIRGSGINQDGKTNGITAPSSKSQERLEREVYESFHINPENIRMVEAHGTGTKLGDPIEVEALTRAFRTYTDKKQYCAIGSIKTNLGHATMAAGVAGVLRVLLSFQHKQIPPSRNFINRNEGIHFEDSPFYVNTRLEEWGVDPGKERCAAVSSFGFSGTNAHLVLTEPPQLDRKHEEKPAYLIVLSARTAQQLKQQADQLASHCNAHADIDCGNISFTLLMGRKHLNHRLAMIVRDVDELMTALKKWSATGKSSTIRVTDIGQKDHREPTSLKSYGNECIGRANDTVDPDQLREVLSIVAELFLQGCQLDYQNVFAHGGYSRIPLPTYPFAQERYWIPASDAVAESIVHRQKTVVSNSPGVKSGGHRSATVTSSDEILVGAVTLTPVWDPVVLDKGVPAESTAERTLVIGASDSTQDVLQRIFPGASFLTIQSGNSLEQIRRSLGNGSIDHLLWIAPPPNCASMFDDRIIQEEHQTTLTCFRLIKALLSLEYAGRELTWTVITSDCQPVLADDDINPVHAGLHGLMGSVAQEYPKWRIRLFDLGEDEVSRLEDIIHIPADPRGAAWACRSNVWYRRHLIPCRNLREQHALYRDGGVYVVIGGAGGIGEIWTEFVIRHHNAHVIWIGRRLQDDDISPKLRRLAAMGHAPLYISADASDADDLERAYLEIKRQHFAIHGVIHSAVGVFDQRLTEMTEERFTQGLSAKVDVSVRIAQVFRRESLDFVLFFSSIESFLTSHGKASYTAGSAFMDAYARQLSRELAAKIKVMNWGFWGEIGAGTAMPETVKNRLARTGVGIIEPDEGMKALSALLAAPCDQLLFMKATKPIPIEILGSSDSFSATADGLVRLTKTTPLQTPRIASPFLSAELGKTQRSDEPQPSRDTNQHVETTAVVKNVIGRVTQVASDNLDMQLTWTELGLDSILAMQVIEGIESELGVRLYPNELIEHDTVGKLSAFLANEVKEASPPAAKDETREPIVFILGTPRSGSTLLRVMLAGHHRLFSPPELHLLPFANFAERTSILKSNNQQFVEEGLIKTLCDLKGISVAEAKAITSSWASHGTSIEGVYKEVQSLCPGKILVDKSPSYASDLAILKKAESLGTNVFYIHLVRHPLAVMESFVRNRFDKLLSVKEDPWVFADRLWHSYNANIETLFANVPPQRWIRIRYEDLVAQPLSTVKELFHQLGIEFDAHVLDPYEGDRMTGGLHGVSLPLSDPNFKKHDKIESDLGTAWEEHLDKTPMLSEATLRLAESYGYRFVKDEKHKLLPAQEAFLNRFGENPVWNIDQFVRVKLDQSLDLRRLRACLQNLVAGHASLRNVCKRENGTWIQQEGDTYSVPLFYVDGNGLSPDELDNLATTLCTELHSCVDGQTRVNLGCGVVHAGNHDYQMILVAHHLAADGISVVKLQKDLIHSYQSPHVASNHASDNRVYAYLNDLQQRVTPSVLNEHKSFWQLHIDSPRYVIPSDFELNGQADDMASELEYEFRVPLRTLGWADGRTIGDFFPYLSAGLYQCLSEWTGQRDIAVAHRLHRRNIGSDHSFADVIGWFAGDIPIKVNLKPSSSVTETASAFREHFASIPMGGISYEMMANSGAIPHCHVICPVRLNYHPGSSTTQKVEIDFKRFQLPSHQRLYVLDLVVSVSKGDCVMLVRYSKRRFREATIADMVKRWVSGLQNVEIRAKAKGET